MPHGDCAALHRGVACMAAVKPCLHTDRRDPLFGMYPRGQKLGHLHVHKQNTTVVGCRFSTIKV